MLCELGKPYLVEAHLLMWGGHTRCDVRWKKVVLEIEDGTYECIAEF